MVPPGAGDSGPGHRAQLSRVEGAVHVELLSARGDRLGERDLAAGDSCGDLAGAVAVVIAAWEADLDPRLAARVSLPAPPSPPPPAPAAVAVQAHAGNTPTSSDLRHRARAARFAVRRTDCAGRAGRRVVRTRRIAPGAGRLDVRRDHPGGGGRAAPGRGAMVTRRVRRRATGQVPRGADDAGRPATGAGCRAARARRRPDHEPGRHVRPAGNGSGRPRREVVGERSPRIGVDLLLWPGRDRLEIAGQTASGESPRLEVQFAVGLNMARVP